MSRHLEHQRSQILTRSPSHNHSVGALSAISPGKSPTRSISGIKLYHFSDLKSYKQISRPFVNEEQKKTLNVKLRIREATSARVQRRLKQNQSFVAFNYNPFYQPHTRS
jgi:hypothetical protein